MLFASGELSISEVPVPAGKGAAFGGVSSVGVQPRGLHACMEAPHTAPALSAAAKPSALWGACRVTRLVISHPCGTLSMQQI